MLVVTDTIHEFSQHDYSLVITCSLFQTYQQTFKLWNICFKRTSEEEMSAGSTMVKVNETKL